MPDSKAGALLWHFKTKDITNKLLSSHCQNRHSSVKPQRAVNTGKASSLKTEPLKVDSKIVWDSVASAGSLQSMGFDEIRPKIFKE